MIDKRMIVFRGSAVPQNLSDFQTGVACVGDQEQEWRKKVVKGKEFFLLCLVCCVLCLSGLVPFVCVCI